MKPLAVDLPYPDLSGIKPDKKTATEVFPLYSSAESELSAILQYVYHALHFGEQREFEIAKILIEIAVCEMEHLKILGELLIKLGANPVYYDVMRADYFCAKYVSFTRTPKRMLLDDVSGEIKAERAYERAIEKIEDEEVGAVLARIKMDESLHITALKGLLEQMK